MRAHARSDIHIQSCEAEMMAARRGTIVQQLQHVSEEEKVKKQSSCQGTTLLRTLPLQTSHTAYNQF